MNSVKTVLWLRSLKGFGNRTIQKLYEACDRHLDILWEMDLGTLRKLKVLSEAQMCDLINRRSSGYSESVISACNKQSIAVVTPWSDTEDRGLYPEGLKHIYDSPVLLFMRGRYELLEKKGIAVVGTRNPSEQGLKVAKEFSRMFSTAGIVVVSGMAEGIDSAAHLGALEGVGGTLAVLGSGIDRPYPALNQRLYERIVQQGLVISEHPLGTAPQKGYFAKRNRIISGLSEGILVAEAGIRSGALITAQYALDQGKSIYAIPGSIKSTRHEGCHALIRQGAQLVTNSREVMDDLRLSSQWMEGNKTSHHDTETVSYHGLYGELWKLIQEHEPIMLENMLEVVKADRSTVFQYVLDLMLDGVVERTPEGAFKAVK